MSGCPEICHNNFCCYISNPHLRSEKCFLQYKYLFSIPIFYVLCSVLLYCHVCTWRPFVVCTISNKKLPLTCQKTVKAYARVTGSKFHRGFNYSSAYTCSTITIWKMYPTRYRKETLQKCTCSCDQKAHLVVKQMRCAPWHWHGRSSH